MEAFTLCSIYTVCCAIFRVGGTGDDLVLAIDRGDRTARDPVTVAAGHHVIAHRAIGRRVIAVEARKGAKVDATRGIKRGREERAKPSPRITKIMKRR